MPNSYRPMFHFKGGEIAGNAQRFATEGEAEQSAYSRLGRWTLPIDYSVEASDDPVNYRFDVKLGDVYLATEAKVDEQ